jgi:hypothetical protein
MIPLPSRTPKRRTETTIFAEVRVAINAIAGCKIWRNNVGEFHGKRSDGSRVDLIYGLRVGSGDGIGWARGRFLSVETKSLVGKARENQREWAAMVRAAGGIALEDIRSAEQAVAELLAAL